MVHFGDASGAVSAMVRAGGLRGGTFLAPAGWGRAGNGRGRRVEFGFGGGVPAGINGAGFIVGVPYAEDEGVEDDALVAGKGPRGEVRGGGEEPL